MAMRRFMSAPGATVSLVAAIRLGKLRNLDDLYHRLWANRDYLRDLVAALDMVLLVAEQDEVAEHFAPVPTVDDAAASQDAFRVSHGGTVTNKKTETFH